MDELSPDEAATYLERLAHDLEAAASDAVARTLETGLVMARDHSTGGLDEAALRAADHPFARRHGSIQPPGRPDQINLQTGEFYAGWKTEQDGTSGALFNDSEHAEFLDVPGTRVMFGRDLPDVIAADLEPVFERNLEAAVGRLVER